MRLIETHAHLCDKAFEADRPAVVGASLSAGVERIVEIACAPAEWKAGAEFCAANSGTVFCAFGAHPEYSAGLPPEALAELGRYLSLPCAVALGEVGVDYWWEEAGPPARQLALLEAQLPLCAAHGKPAVFHARNGRTPEKNAYADLLAALRRWGYAPKGRFRGVLHCFSGSWEDARAGLDLGLALGVNGTITYKNNDVLRAAVKKAGLDNIVLETDCPYLPPQSARGRRNDPSFLPEIAAMTAACLGAATGEVAERTTRNALELFWP